MYWMITKKVLFSILRIILTAKSQNISTMKSNEDVLSMRKFKTFQLSLSKSSKSDIKKAIAAKKKKRKSE